MSDGIYVRFGEETKTPEQISHRDATYAAKKILREAGVECYVVEYFTLPTDKITAGIIVGNKGR